MHGFWAHEPLVNLTENQRRIARGILLGDWGEFPRENDDENGPETGVETATKAGPFPTRETPSRRSENVVTYELNARVTIEVHDIGRDQHRVMLETEIGGVRIRETLTGYMHIHDVLRIESAWKRQSADRDEAEMLAEMVAEEKAAEDPGYRPLTILGTVCGRCHETLLRVSYANGEAILFELTPIFMGTDVLLADHSCPAEPTPETLAAEAEAIDKADQLLSRVLRGDAEGGAE